MEYDRAIILGLCFVLGNIILNKYGNVSQTNIVKVLMTIPIFYFGYLFKRFESKILFNKYIALLSVMLMFCNSFYKRVDIANNYYNSPAFYLLASITGIYLNIYIAKLIERKVTNWSIRLLDYIGKNTIVILALHWLVFELVNVLYTIVTNNSSEVLSSSSYGWLILSIAGVIIPVILKVIIDKMKTLLFNSKKENIVLNS